MLDAPKVQFVRPGVQPFAVVAAFDGVVFKNVATGIVAVALAILSRGAIRCLIDRQREVKNLVVVDRIEDIVPHRCRVTGIRRDPERESTVDVTYYVVVENESCVSVILESVLMGAVSSICREWHVAVGGADVIDEIVVVGSRSTKSTGTNDEGARYLLDNIVIGLRRSSEE